MRWRGVKSNQYGFQAVVMSRPVAADSTLEAGKKINDSSADGYTRQTPPVLGTFPQVTVRT